MPSATTRRLIDDDKRYLWHPFTQMEDWLADEPVVIERGEGIELIDTEGNRYLDGVSSLWTNVHGHRVEEIDRAVAAQLDRLAHSTLLGLANVPSIELACELIRLAPSSLAKVFYSDSGSTAVEIALKMAFQYWQQRGEPFSRKRRFACVDDAYHGDTIGSVSVGGVDLFHRMYKPLLFDTVKLPSPHCYRCPLGKQQATCDLACAGVAELTIAERRDELAAVVMEPLVQGAAGMITHPEGYLSRIAAACRQHGVLLILDEVATGFGRTGSMFACEREGVEPDLMALAKGISGGYLPLAATLASEEVFAGFLGPYTSYRTFFHGHTYTGNPLACATALASLELFATNQVLEHVGTIVGDLARELAPLAQDPHVGEVRQCGVMVGIELVQDTSTRQPFDPGLRVGNRVILEARTQGVMIRPLGDVVVLNPPLAISREQLQRLVEVTRASIATVTAAL